jgi:hypothetical protein
MNFIFKDKCYKIQSYHKKKYKNKKIKCFNIIEKTYKMFKKI